MYYWIALHIRENRPPIHSSPVRFKDKQLVKHDKYIQGLHNMIERIPPEYLTVQYHISIISSVIPPEASTVLDAIHRGEILE
jgi:hypothetical protein